MKVDPVIQMMKQHADAERKRQIAHWKGHRTPLRCAKCRVGFYEAKRKAREED